MYELGRRQILYVDHRTDFGLYLCDHIRDKGDDAECILLPKKQAPSESKKGDEIEAFIYKDSKDRIIATTNIPKIMLGEVKVLEVVEINKIGAFLDWGLEKDLLLPYSEQLVKVKKGDRFLVALYIDKSERLCATMKVYEYLQTDSDYKVNDMIHGIIFSMNPQYGAFVAIDNRYLGLIPKGEMVKNLMIGQEVDARITEVREDGKINLSLREKGYVQMSIDSMMIMQKLDEQGGFLPYHDKSSPADIKEVFGMSKNEYKRAIGRLYKLKKISITPEGIKKI